MKFLDNIKNMFNNKEDVTSFRSSKSPITSTFIDTHIINELNYVEDMIIYWGLKIDKEVLDQWMQVSELFNHYKLYPFEKHYVILLSLNLDDIKYAFENCRFSNNLVMDALRTTIEFEIPLKYFEYKLDLDKYNFSKERFIRPDKEMNLEFDENDDKIIEQEYVTHGTCDLFIYYITDINDLIDKILYTFDELTPYLNKSDIYDLARIVITMRMSTLSMYRRLKEEDCIKVYSGRILPEDYLNDSNMFDDGLIKKLFYPDIFSCIDEELYNRTKNSIVDSINDYCKEYLKDHDHVIGNEYLYPLAVIEPMMFIYNFKQLYKILTRNVSDNCEMDLFQIDLTNILNKYDITVDNLAENIEPVIYKVQDSEEEVDDEAVTQETVEVINVSDVPESNQV